MQHSQGDEEDRRPDSDLVVGGQQAHADGAGAHEREGDDDRVLAAEAVTEVAEDDPAERAGDETDREGREGGERADGGGGVGEEQRPEHEGGRGAVDVEVEPFDGGADEGGDTGASCCPGVVHRAWRRGRGVL